MLCRATPCRTMPPCRAQAALTSQTMTVLWPIWAAACSGVMPSLARTWGSAPQVWALSVLQAEHSAGRLQLLRWEHSGHQDMWGTGIVWMQSTGVWDSQLWGHGGSV